MNQKLFFHMAVLLILFIKTEGNIQAQRNMVIPVPDIWLMADSINYDQNHWIDISGHENHFGFNSPFIPKSINFQTALKIDSDVPLFIPFISKSKGGISVFAVYKTDTAQNGHSIWSVRFDSTDFIEMNSGFLRDLWGLHLYNTTGDSAAILNYYKSTWSGQHIDTSYNRFRILGGDSISTFKGLFAEIMVYNKALNSKDLCKISTYLAIKYGISLKNMNYIKSDNAIIWNSKENKEYSSNIAGIGKDKKLLIDQKQSAGNGGQSELKMFSGNSINILNQQNPTQIGNGDFLIWGDNGMPLTSNNTDTINSDSPDSLMTNTITEKKWLLKRTGASAHLIPTLVVLNAPSLASDTTKFVSLLISRNSNFQFPIDSCIAIPSDSTDSLGNLYFHNIFWDVDSSGKDAFCFLINEILISQDSLSARSTFAGEIMSDTSSFIKVYPNPTTGIFTIEVKIPHPGTVSYIIHDETGRMVMHKQLNNEQYYLEEIQLEPKGVYLLNVESESINKFLKVVVQ